MKTIIVKICVFVLILTLALGMSACSGYADSYRATLLIRSSLGGSCEIRFDTLDGRVSQRISNPSDSDGAFLCTATLEEGEISVTYMTPTSHERQPLFTLKGGESIEDERLGYLTNGERARIIVETVGGKAARGRVEISIVE